jgi:hypothetical protein
VENPIFRDAAAAMKRSVEAMHRAQEALVHAHGETVIAVTAMSTALDKIIEAHDEHEDLRETVHRLEALVLGQSRDLKALRERLNGGGVR